MPKVRFLKNVYPYLEWDEAELDEARYEMNKDNVELVKEAKKAENKAILEPKTTKGVFSKKK